MKNLLRINIVFVLFLCIAINAQEKPVTRGIPIFITDFEIGIPGSFELIDGDCGWAIGEGSFGSPGSGGSNYFPIPEHDGKYAYVNDDSCNGDMSDVWMILPPIDFSEYSAPRLIYDQFNTAYDILTVKVSTDNKETWTDFPTERGGNKWITSIIDLVDFEGLDSVFIAFHYNDNGDWGRGWAIDNIIIETPFERDMLVIDIFPYGGIAGKTVIPKVVVKNDGISSESEWSVTITDNISYTSTKNGSDLSVGETITVEMDEWIQPAGNINLKATITLLGDENPNNDIMEKIITISDGYSSSAYAGNLTAGTYNTFDIQTGELTFSGTISNTSFPISEEYNGNYIYRLLIDNTIGYVYPDGIFEPVGKLSGIDEDDYAVTMSYNWNNDKWYLFGSDYVFYSFDISDLEVIRIAYSGLSDMLIAMDFAHDGYIYGPCFDGYLYKIDPVTGNFEQVGETGIDLYYQQDVSYDYEHFRLYSIACNSSAIFTYGFYDIATGEFVTIHNYGDGQQRTPFVILNEPNPYYTFTMIVTDGTNPIEGAKVTIFSENTSISTVYYTDSEGVIQCSLINGTYSYNISISGYLPKSGQFTIDNEDEILEIELTEIIEYYTVTFNIANEVGSPLNANVFIINNESVIYEGTTIDGTIIFNDVLEGEYIYNVESEGYDSILGVKLIVNENITENIIMNYSNIKNVSFQITYYINEIGLLTVDIGNEIINLEVWSMNGQLVKKSNTNCVFLPQRGVYAVKAYFGGKVIGFKVVW